MSPTIPDRDAASVPLPPSQDPWYTAPDGFESAKPGTVLRIRHTAGNLTDLLQKATASYNVLYRTTDARDRPSWAVTTVFLPTTYYVSPSKTHALLSYQFAYNSVNLDSSPSYILYYSSGNGTNSNLALVDTLLGYGWIVNAPDHEGPLAAYATFGEAGPATLDSLRAILSLGELTGAADTTTAIWGYSGGSFATGAAAELNSQYAPDVSIAGTALGGFVDNFVASFDLINKSPIAANFIAALLGVTVRYPDEEAYLRSRLKPETADEFLAAKDLNVLDAVSRFAMQDVYAYFINGKADLQAPNLQELFKAEMRIGYRGLPTSPIFTYKAIGDEYCPVNSTDALVRKFCDAGVQVEYERNKVGGHVAEIENGKPNVIAWLHGIFNGSYEPSGCSIRNVEIDLSAK